MMERRFTYQVSSSSGSIPAADYFVLISFCIESVHICLIPQSLDLGLVERERSEQKQALTVTRKTHGLDQHFYFDNRDFDLSMYLRQPRRFDWGGSDKEVRSVYK